MFSLAIILKEYNSSHYALNDTLNTSQRILVYMKEYNSSHYALNDTLNTSQRILVYMKEYNSSHYALNDTLNTSQRILVYMLTTFVSPSVSNKSSLFVCLFDIIPNITLCNGHIQFSFYCEITRMLPPSPEKLKELILDDPDPMIHVGVIFSWRYCKIQ